MDNSLVVIRGKGRRSRYVSARERERRLRKVVLPAFLSQEVAEEGLNPTPLCSKA